MPQAEDHTGFHDLVPVLVKQLSALHSVKRRCHGIEAQRGFLQLFAVVGQEIHEFNPEIVERKFTERYVVVHLLQIDHLVSEPDKLLLTIGQFFSYQGFELIGIEKVVRAAGSKVHHRHTRFDAVLEIDVLIQIISGPEVDELNLLINAAQAVYSAEALDDPHRVPVDVIVNEIIAVLQVLSL
ncbi:hypothetical protein BMS3Bbin04_00213 [bacterium BMS3Bbin04]|nr:hypothetical protein BMS3Bbin04_00213 [bacterium BMS3Bbin04]